MVFVLLYLQYYFIFQENTYIHTYTHILTYLFHGAESFLRS